MLKKIHFILLTYFLYFSILLYPLSIFYKFLGYSISYIFILFILFISLIRLIIYIKSLSLFYILGIYLLYLLVNNIINIKFLFFMFMFILFIVIGFNYKRFFVKKKFIKSFIKFSVIISIIGIVLFFLKIPLFDFKVAGSSKYFMLSNGYYRAMSIFLNPNSFAYFIIFSISLLLFYGKYLFSKKMYLIYLIIYLFSLYISYSRSAIFSMSLIFVIYFIYKLKIPKNLKLIFYIFILVFLFNIFCFLIINRELFFNVDIRFLKIDIALDFIKNNFYNFIFGYPYNVSINKNGISFSDNMFLYFFLRGGVILFIIFNYIYIIALLKSIKFIVLKKTEIGYAVYLFSTLPLMFFSNFLLFFPNIILFSISIGIILNRRRYNEKSVNS